jgi:penicillin-binding protein 2
VAFAPADEPQIIISVLVEGGGEGSSVAAPIAKKVLEEWFKK